MTQQSKVNRRRFLKAAGAAVAGAGAVSSLTPEDLQPAATSRLQDRNPREQNFRDRAAVLSLLYRNPDSSDTAKSRV